MGISIGIVGVGSFGSSFVRLFKDHPLVHRFALCDVVPDRLASVAAAAEILETYDSLDAILKSDLDAVALFTQPWLHAPQAILALEAGKHVYSAVPIICIPSGEESLEWCDRLAETCSRTGQFYMMGETSYYRPEAMYCRKRAIEGAFGRFVFAQGEYFHDIDSPGCSLRAVERQRRGPSWDPRFSGGTPMHYPTHSIGGLLGAMQTHLTEVSAIGYIHPGDDWFRPDTEDGNIFSNETALFRCADGAAVRIAECRRIGHPEREAFELFGTEGSFRHGYGGAFWMTRSEVSPLITEQMRDPLPEETMEAYRRSGKSDAEILGGHGGSHAYLVDEFVRAVAERRQPAINAWKAIRFFAPGVVAHQSALRDGELLNVPDWGDGPA